MRIFFTTPYSGKQFFQPFLDEIMDVLKAHEAIIVSPENTHDYQQSLHEYQALGIPPTRAHYEFVTRGIVDADLVIIEASQESLRLGHEITMALLFGKPTLVVSQNKNYADYITHQLLQGVTYKTKQELRKIIKRFITTDAALLSTQKTKTAPGAATDDRRLTTLATMRQQALMDDSDYGKFADFAEQDPEAAYTHAKQIFSDLPVEKEWSHSSYIYNEDVPDFVFEGVMRHILHILSNYSIKKDSLLVDAYTHGGTVSRLLAKAEFTNITAFSSSRAMLSHTYKLCEDIPEIAILEATPESLHLPKPADAIIWIDYTTNLALNEKTLKSQLQNLVNNLKPNGIMLFDIRTETGWDAYLFKEKVATYATKNFQRIWLQEHDKAKKHIHFDIFIRTKQNDGAWGQWHRETLVDHIWSIAEIKAMAASLNGCSLEAVYDDDFRPFQGNHEPNLAYFVLKRTS